MCVCVCVKLSERLVMRELELHSVRQHQQLLRLPVLDDTTTRPATTTTQGGVVVTETLSEGKLDVNCDEVNVRYSLTVCLSVC